MGCAPSQTRLAQNYLATRRTRPHEHFVAIVAGKVVPGMSFLQADFASGRTARSVIVNNGKFNGSTLYRELLAAEHVKGSRVNIIYKNVSQFDTSVPEHFTVTFVDGRAITIRRGQQRS
jgi:hypothetical protein